MAFTTAFGLLALLLTDRVAGPKCRGRRDDESARSGAATNRPDDVRPDRVSAPDGLLRKNIDGTETLGPRRYFTREQHAHHPSSQPRDSGNQHRVPRDDASSSGAQSGRASES